MDDLLQGETADQGRHGWQSAAALSAPDHDQDLPHDRRPQPAPGGPCQVAAHLDALMVAVLSPTAAAAADCLARILAAGVAPETVADVYVPAVARRLGDRWLDDVTSFADVTIGCARLQAMLRPLAERWERHAVTPSHRILIAVPEGEDHTLGTVLAAGQFRRAGVEVCLRLNLSAKNQAIMAASKGFHAIMLPLSQSARLETVTASVHLVRRAAPSGTPILVGGAAVTDQDDVRASTGCDHACSDVPSAMRFLLGGAGAKCAQRRA